MKKIFVNGYFSVVTVMGAVVGTRKEKFNLRGHVKVRFKFFQVPGRKSRRDVVDTKTLVLDLQISRGFPVFSSLPTGIGQRRFGRLWFVELWVRSPFCRHTRHCRGGWWSAAGIAEGPFTVDPGV